jgi:two-component sensor histidine kinase
MEGAFDVVHKGFIEIESITPKKNMATARLNGALGVMYYDLNELDLSLSNYNQALIHAKSSSDYSFKAYINIGIAAIKKKHNKLSAAKSLLQQVIKQSTETQMMWMMEARARYEIGTIYKLEDKLDLATEFLEQSYSIRKLKEAKPGMVSNLIALAEIEILQKKNDEALERLNTALQIAALENLKPKQSRILSLISSLYEERGDIQLAFEFLKQHNTIAREVELEEKTNRLKHIQLRYTIEKAKKDAASQRDINQKLKNANTLITKQKNALATSNHEKELLLKEIHHRVKNNMQVIASLVSLQVRNIKDVTTVYELEQIRNRITAMAMIHEMLYQSKDLAQINYGKYIKKMVQSLVDSMKDYKAKIHLKLNVRQIHLNVDTAIPLGLIINELVTNSLKYAFPNGDSGCITLKITEGQDQYEMHIGDDGVGFPKGFDYDKSTSLGIRLVHNLVEQLDGSLNRTNGVGTHYAITFKEIDSAT